MAQDMHRPATAGPDISDVGRWQDDTILLVMTYSKLHRYIPGVRRNLDLFWPNRPRTVYASDAPLEGEDVLVTQEGSFLDVLQASVTAISAQFPHVNYVFIMLEDLCPLGPMDDDKMARAQKLLRAGDYKQLSHIGQNRNPYQFNYFPSDAPVVLADDVIHIPSIPRWEPFHNSLASSIWELNHLADIAEKKRNLGHLDPWSFELPVAPVYEDHFFWVNSWPTVPAGFLTQGAIHAKALTAKQFPPSPLRTQLRREYCGYDSGLLAELKRRQLRLKSKAKRRAAFRTEHIQTSQHSE